MTDELSREEKHHLEAFVSSHFDIPKEELQGRIQNSFEAEKFFELDFVNKTEKGGSHQDFVQIPPELVALTTYIREIIEYNLDGIPQNNDGYVEQVEIEESKIKELKKKPNLAPEQYLDEDDMEDIFLRIEDTLGQMESEIDNLPGEMQSQIRTVLAMIRYAIHKENTADIKNAHRPLRYILRSSHIAYGRYTHGYHKIGHKIDVMFDSKEDAVEELTPYFAGTKRQLTRVVEKAEEKQDD